MKLFGEVPSCGFACVVQTADVRCADIERKSDVIEACRGGDNGCFCFFGKQREEMYAFAFYAENADIRSRINRGLQGLCNAEQAVDENALQAALRITLGFDLFQKLCIG